MKLDHLRYFEAAARHGSFSLAGAKLHISPSSIGYAVGILEDELKTSLFVRKPSKGLTLTTDGKRLLQQSRQILADFETVEDQFKGPDDQLRGELVVGGQEGLIWSLLPRAIHLMSRDHPRLKISSTMTTLDSNFEALENGELDVLITFREDETGPANCDVSTLCRPSLCVMMREGHPLDQGDEQSVSLKDLAEFPQIVNSEPAAHNLALEAFSSVGASPEIHFASNVAAGTQALVGQSDNVSLRFLRPSSSVSPLGHRLVYRRLKDELPSPFLVLATIKSRTPTIRNKRDVMRDICVGLFERGDMREHLFY